MTDVNASVLNNSSVEVDSGTKDPNRIPHLLSALDKFLMQNPTMSVVDVITNVALKKGCDVTDVTDEDITKFAKEKAVRW